MARPRQKIFFPVAQFLRRSWINSLVSESRFMARPRQKIFFPDAQLLRRSWINSLVSESRFMARPRQKIFFPGAQFLRRSWINNSEPQLENGKKSMTNHYTRRSINIDNDNFLRCKTLAAEMAVSISGVVRLLIKDAYERHLMGARQDAVGPAHNNKTKAERLISPTRRKGNIL